MHVADKGKRKFRSGETRRKLTSGAPKRKLGSDSRYEDQERINVWGVQQHHICLYRPLNWNQAPWASPQLHNQNNSSSTADVSWPTMQPRSPCSLQQWSGKGSCFTRYFDMGQLLRCEKWCLMVRALFHWYGESQRGWVVRVLHHEWPKIYCYNREVPSSAVVWGAFSRKPCPAGL